MLGGASIVNRTQALVLGFFLMVVVSLVVIRAATPDVYDQALKLPASWPPWAGTAFLFLLVAFIALLAVGVLRRWRWLFWLILVAFLAGVLRVPVAALQLSGVLATDVPSWYVVFQGVIGLAQLAIGLAMLAGYRRSGISPAGFELRRPRQPCPPHALAWAALGPRTIGNRGSATDNSGKQMPRSQRCRPIAAGLECA